jgi:dCTP deaminase
LQFKQDEVTGIDPADLVFLLQPGEFVLAHTREFIGSASPFITTKMYARSSSGRNFLEVCRCAGLGDIGYHNRWTLEVVNTSRFHTVPLVVGRRVAQLEFFQVEPVEDLYSASGKYQTAPDLATLKATWKPEDMLPRLYKDREVVGAE